MAGCALFVDLIQPPNTHSPAWTRFLESVQDHKCLEKTSDPVQESNSIAVKLDAACSLHQGITCDPQSGSWLMAVGTVIDRENIRPDGNLRQLLQDFQKDGARVFARLEGQFALVVYHAGQNSLNVVSDPFGLIPVYYGQEHDQLFIATSAFAVAKAVHAALNEDEARSFLFYGDTLNGSLWDGVHTLKPATVLTITPEKIREIPYWSFQLDTTTANLSLDQSVNCLIDGLAKTEKEFVGREGRFWASLTGGLDSRTLAAIAQHSNLPFKTYCHGPSDARDVILSKAISQQMGWEYEYFDLPSDWGNERVGWLQRTLGQTDGHLDVLKMSRILREQAIKARQMNVSLWGYGGELYRGYYWKQELWNAGRTTKVDYDRLINLRVIPSDAAILKNGAKWQQSLRDARKSQLRAVGEQQPDLPNTVKLELIGQYLERHQASNTIAAILGQQRVLLPYYSKDNIVRVLSTNHRWRSHSKMVRYILERINPKLASLETADGGPALPMRVTNIDKFFPYWFDTGEKLLWKVGRKYFGRSLWARRDSGPQGKAYPSSRWLQETIAQLRECSLLVPKKMLTASFFDEERLQALLTGSEGDQRSRETLISRIVTLEMSLRTVRNEM